jgi:hypothetical protein
MKFLFWSLLSLAIIAVFPIPIVAFLIFAFWLIVDYLQNEEIARQARVAWQERQIEKYGYDAKL